MSTQEIVLAKIVARVAELFKTDACSTALKPGSSKT